MNTEKLKAPVSSFMVAILPVFGGMSTILHLLKNSCSVLFDDVSDLRWCWGTLWTHSFFLSVSLSVIVGILFIVLTLNLIKKILLTGK